MDQLILIYLGGLAIVLMLYSMSLWAGRQHKIK